VNQNASVRFVDASGFRADLWRVALDEFRSHPLGGLGAGNYDTQYYRLRRNPEYVVQPHSLELQMAAELGVGGIVALVLFCGGVLYAGVVRRGTIASQDPFIKVAAVGMFAAWLAATSVDWLYDIPGLAGMAVVAAGLLVVRTAPEAEAGGRNRTRRGALVVGLGVLALLAASVGRQYVASRYAKSGAAEVARSPQAALSTLQEAVRLDPYSLSTLYSIASAYASVDDYRNARATLLEAARREPHNYVPAALLGDLATRRGDRRTAATEYRRALELNPRESQLAVTVQGAIASQR
jgi:hypothetical protein